MSTSSNVQLNEQVLKWISETKEAINTTQEEFDKVVNIILKEGKGLTGDEAAFIKRCVVMSGSLADHKQKLTTDLEDLKVEEKNYREVLKKSSEVYLLLFVCNAFRGKPV